MQRTVVSTPSIKFVIALCSVAAAACSGGADDDRAQQAGANTGGSTAQSGSGAPDASSSADTTSMQMNDDPAESGTAGQPGSSGSDATPGGATPTGDGSQTMQPGSDVSGAAGTTGSDAAPDNVNDPGSEAPAGDLPLVYPEERTGVDCEAARSPAFEELPAIAYLPDPFLRADGTRIASRSEWGCLRAETMARIERWDVGAKPDKPSTFEAQLSGNTLEITVGEGGNSFRMTAPIRRPSGAPSGPIPAIIGINTPTGSLPAKVFSSRGIATITFESNQIMSSGFSGGSRASGNFHSLYPQTTAGSMIRWAWGVSRIIDALQALPEANIDTEHLAVSGCSYQGKIALYAGAFDERIALTIPHESGGGGTISWRYADMLEDRDRTEVENLRHALGAPWYAEALAQFVSTPDKLPFDHHQLIGLIAPRAVLAIESSQIARMGAEAARVDALAAREIYDALGVPTRMGATEENTGHCVWHAGFTPDLEAYVDKFLLGKETDTDILRSKFTDVDRATWIPWETPTLQ